MNEKPDVSQLLSFLSAPIALADDKKNIIFANAEAKKILGISETQANPMSFDKIFGLEAKQLQNMEDLLYKDKSFTSGCTLDKKDDSTKINFSIHPIRNQQMPQLRYCIEIQDLSQDVLEIEDVRQIGRFTGHLAHDLSNPLAILRIQCDTILLKLKNDKPIDKEDFSSRMGKVSRATDRIIDLNESIKSLSRQMVQGETELLREIARKVGAPNDFDH